MITLTASDNNQHRWRFFRAGGFDQVRLDTGADLMALDQLDQKLWVSLSCPVHGLEFDTKTLELIDTDGDGRIRVPEILAAVKWAGGLLKNPDDLTKASPELRLDAINDASDEGRQILASCRQILADLGKPGTDVITLDDTADTARIFAQTRFNGDGIIICDAADDPAVEGVINDIMACFGPEVDRSGLPGINLEKLDQFFQEAQALSDWWKAAEADPATILPMGEATSAAYETLAALKGKIDDYFVRCRLAAFDPKTLPVLNRQEADYALLAAKDLPSASEDLAAFPLARAEAERPLPLGAGVNPAWSSPMEAFSTRVVEPLLGKKSALQETEWNRIKSTFSAYEGWLGTRAGTAVEGLGLGRIREILAGGLREQITGLIAKDKALEPEANAIAAVDRLVRYQRDLYPLLNNFVAFRDFYTRKARAVFQAGTLYLDGRSCELCIRVTDMGKHGALAGLGKIYLAYCECTRKDTPEKMVIAAAVTNGDSGFLLAGRNGVFYDRQGRDWDATIVKIVENPISIRQAFWAPYRRIGRMVGEQIEKFAAAKDKAITDKSSAGIDKTAKAADAPAPAAAPAAPFDIAKFAGIFAAVGLALGAIGSAIAMLVTGFLQLRWWQMPLVVVGALLVVSGPSMIIAWLKLRQRNLGPILDASGWAVNARAKINLPFGASLTGIAKLPEGAERSMDDPYAEKPSPWPKLIIFVIILIFLLLGMNELGLLHKLVGIGKTAG